MMVVQAKMCMQQSSFNDNYDALVKKIQEIHEVHCLKEKLFLMKEEALGHMFCQI